MNIVFNELKFNLFLLNIFLIIISTIYNKSFIIVNLFYLIYTFIIYKKFSTNNRKYLYYTVLFYALVTGGNSKYVFIFYLIYLIELFLDNRTNHFNKANDVIKYKKYYVFFFIFISYMFLSIFIAKYKIESIKYLLKYMIMIAIFIMMVIENRDIKNLNGTLRFLCVFYAGILALGTLELFGIKYGPRNIFMDKNMVSSYIKRIPEVFYYNPNNYSVVLDLGIAALFIKSLFTDMKKEKIFYYFLIFLSEVQLIFASSRIAWIVLFCTFMFIIFVGIINIKNNKMLAKTFMFRSIMAFILSFILFFMLALLPSMSPYYKKFADSIVINKVRESVLPKNYIDNMKIHEDVNINTQIKIGGKGSENERFTLMKNVVDGVIVERNLLGFGVGNIGSYVKQKNNTFGIINIHSFWFEYLGDFGIFMFAYLIIIYCMMLLDLFKLYWTSNNNSKEYYIILLILGIIMVLLAFSPSTVIGFSPFWIVLGMNFGIASNKLNYLA
ncbi:O-antigen ligase family protein [Clostridium niameyense]|nr:O-antigen ligase family protein [Clostridium niameyense]